MSLEIRLTDFCRLKKADKAMAFLGAHISDRIDVLHNRGVCFRLAVKYDQPKLFEALIDYYKETKLNRWQDQEIYRKSLVELQDFLHNIVENSITSIEIRDLMREYISFDTRTDMIDIKSKTNAVGLRIPYLDHIDDIKELDIEHVYIILMQLRDLKHSLEVTSKSMYIDQYAAQSKVITDSIELLESQYDLGNKDEETSLSKSENVFQVTKKLDLAKLEVTDDSVPKISPDRIMLWLASLGDARDEQDISDFKHVIDINHSVIMHKSRSEPDLIKHKSATKLFHCSSESLMSVLDSSVSTDIHEMRNLGQEHELFEGLFMDA